MVKITKKYIPVGTAARPGIARSGLLGVTVHNTGNKTAGAGAASHAVYMTVNGGQNAYASYHYVVDEKEAFNLAPESEVTWHAGDGAGGPGNSKTISIEICDNVDGDATKATDNAVEIVADILKRHGLSAEKNLFQHASWMAKDCPHEIRHGIPYSWAVFCEKVRVAMLPKAASKPAAAPAPKPAPKPKEPAKQLYTVQDSAGNVIGTNEDVLKARALCTADCRILDRSGRVVGTKDTETVWRLYNPNSGGHHYTVDCYERDYLEVNGWKYEGVAWTAPLTGQEIFRLYSGKEHLLTTSHAEHDKLEKMGWQCEGTGMHAGSGKPVYRLYNKNAGMHHVTADEKEKQNLVNAGWLPEGIAFRAA